METILSQGELPPGSTMQWLALYTRANCERVVRDQLRGRGFEALAPQERSGRREARALFPGYVFVRTRLEARHLVVQVPYVVLLVRFGGVPAIIPEEQLRPYAVADRHGITVQRWPYLETGMLVRVVSGVLTGVVGIFEQRRGRNRLVMNINLLRGAAAVEIAEECIEPMAPPGCAAGALSCPGPDCRPNHPQKRPAVLPTAPEA